MTTIEWVKQYVLDTHIEQFCPGARLVVWGTYPNGLPVAMGDEYTNEEVWEDAKKWIESLPIKKRPKIK